MSSGKGVDHLSQRVGNVNLGSSDDGPWEEVSKKQKGRPGRPWGQQQASAPKAWGQPDTAQRLGIRNANAPGAWNASGNDSRRQGVGLTKPSVMASPLDRGRNWVPRTGSSQAREEVIEDKVEEKTVEDEDEDDEVYTDDDDELLSDEYDSDDGRQSHETRKQHRMLKGFFEMLDTLTVPEINDPVRQWHCPACQGGPGAIDWYRGVQPLITHARTKGSIRVKLHREFANLLDEELRRKGTSVVPAGESFGQWEGLKQEIQDHEIVWPPMVFVMNTRLEKDGNDKWLGMGNQELLEIFKDYAAVKARHSYGPMGHRGFSVLIFESSAIGYLEAERLHKHFLGERTGRNAWESSGRVLFRGGKRQLYGFLARKEDLDEFNKHCQGKTKQKYDIRSYQEMVVAPMKQMNQDNQQLTYFKNKVAKEARNAKALEESLSIVSQKLRITKEENRLVKQRTKEQHEQNRKEMDAQEQFFGDQIRMIHESTKAKEDNFEKLQQEVRRKVEEVNADASNRGDHRNKLEEVTKFKECQDQEMEEFVVERDELIEKYGRRKMEMKKRHCEEEVELEKELDANLTKLMDKYAPHAADETAANA